MRHRGKETLMMVMMLVAALNALPIAAATRVRAVSPAIGDNGTSLSVIAGPPTVTCDPSGLFATVTANYTVVSTGSADSAVMVASFGGHDYALPTIASGNVTGGGGWTISGRTKTAEGTFTTTTTNGTYTLSICATQSGAGGRDSKTACSAPVTVTVNCTVTDPCASGGVFGEVPANKNLCKANGHIEVQFRGNFGDVATLVISGPGGFTLSTGVDRAGDSCNYHYNWDPAANMAAGSYTFTVNGDLTFSADLVCDSHN